MVAWPRLARGAWAGLLAGVITFAMIAVYVGLLQSEGTGDLSTTRARAVIVWLAAAGIAAVTGGVVPHTRVRFALLAVAAFMLLVWGSLAMFSIGLPLFVAGVFALVAADAASRGMPARVTFPMAVGAGAGAIAVAAVVLTAT